MRRFDPEREFEFLLAELEPSIPEARDSPVVTALLEMQAERAWERWLSREEWALLGCIARAGEGLGMVPDEWNTCPGVMLWALGLVRNATDYEFDGIDVRDDNGIFLKTEHPTSVTEDWGHVYNSDTKEYRTTGWSNDIYILGTMYGANGEELKPPPGIAGYYEDPDWEVLAKRSQEFLRNQTTRCELPMNMLGELLLWIDYQRMQAQAPDPKMAELMQAAMEEAELVRNGVN